MKTKHIRFTRNAAFALIAAVALPVPALADLCQNPEVTIFNDKTDDMDVRKIEYFDGCDGVWRTEDVNNTIIPQGRSESFDDDLEYVQGCEIPAFRLFRRVLGEHGWTSVIWGGFLYPEEGIHVVCDAGAKYTLRNP
jgi:hypothetical protein